MAARDQGPNFGGWAHFLSTVGIAVHFSDNITAWAGTFMSEPTEEGISLKKRYREAMDSESASIL